MLLRQIGGIGGSALSGAALFERVHQYSRACLLDFVRPYYAECRPGPPALSVPVLG